METTAIDSVRSQLRDMADEALDIADVDQATEAFRAVWNLRGALLEAECENH